MIAKIILIALAVLLGLLLIALVRALRIRPTAAQNARSPESDPVRAGDYARKLSVMLQQETVSTRDETDFAKYRAFQEALKPLFPLVFAHCEIYHPMDQLIIRYPAVGTPKGEPILLMSHHDVVPAVSEGWTHPPFSGHIDEDGVIWGRGAVDTKCDLMCELQALEELIAAGWKPEKDVYITSSCTEEWGGPGAPAIVQWLKDRGVHLGMLMDEGGMVLEAPLAGVHGRYCMVGCLEKGSGSVKLTARGKGGHASAPAPNGPLVRLGKLMADIEKHPPFHAEFHPVVREMFRRLSRNADFGIRFIFGNMWLFEGLLKKILGKLVPIVGAMIRTTCAFTMAGGSSASNVLPREAYVVANMRFALHQDEKASVEALRRRAAKFDVEVEDLRHEIPCPAVDYTAGPFALLEEIAAEIYPGYDVVPYAMTGGTDARMFTDVCDHCLRFAPIEITQAQYASIHSRNECIDARALPPGVDYFKRILQEYCSRTAI